MAATITLYDILIELAERYGLGTVLSEIDPDNITSTTITLADDRNSGPVTAASIPVNSSITLVKPCDSGTATASSTTTITDSTKSWTASEWIGAIVRMGGWRATITANTSTALTFSALDAAPTIGDYSIEFQPSRVAQYVPSTGVITTTPTTATPNAAMVKPFTAIIWGKDIDHGNRAIQAVNRAMRRCKRVLRVPFTQGLKGADLRGTAADWTTSNAIVAYTDTTNAENGLDRTLTVTTTSTSGYATTGNVPVHPTEIWDFMTSILSDGTNTARLTIRDMTNSADITPTFLNGAATSTAFSHRITRGYFTVPSGCNQIQFRLGADESAATVDFGPLVTARQGSTQYTTGAWVLDQNDIQNFWTATVVSDTTNQHGQDEMRWRQYDVAHSMREFADGPVVDFLGCTPPFPLYYDALVPQGALTALAGSTKEPLDRVVDWAYYELTNQLMRDEMTEGKRSDNGQLLPSVWRPIRNAALKKAMWSKFEPEMANVAGRR